MATIIIFFWIMVLTQVIIKPNLKLVRYTADFIKILEVSEFPIGLYCGPELFCFFSLCACVRDLEG